MNELRDKITALIIEGELQQALTLSDRIDVSRESADSIIALIRERLLADDAMKAAADGACRTHMLGKTASRYKRMGKASVEGALDVALGGE